MMSITITALLPRLVPTRIFATGSIATMRMMNGMLRKMFTNTPTSELSQPTGWMPSRAVTRSSTPSGSPSRYATPVEMSVM